MDQCRLWFRKCHEHTWPSPLMGLSSRWPDASAESVCYNDTAALVPPLMLESTFSLLYLIKGGLCHRPQTVKSSSAPFAAFLCIQYSQFNILFNLIPN